MTESLNVGEMLMWIVILALFFIICTIVAVYVQFGNMLVGFPSWCTMLLLGSQSGGHIMEIPVGEVSGDCAVV